MPEPYQPIDCGFHDELESLCVRGVRCTIEVQNGEATTIIQSRIVDVYSRNKEEFLKTDDGQVFRLDRIRSVNGMQSGDCQL